MIKQYSERKTEDRKIALINTLSYSSVIDLGCGNGGYLPYMQRRVSYVVGLDVDRNLAKISKRRGVDIVLASVNYLPFKEKSFDCVWASEVIEHFPTIEVLDEIERIASKKIILTLPNPVFPDFKRDPTHVLQYSVTSLKGVLGKKLIWSYKVRGLGVNYMIPTKLIKNFTLWATWFVPWISPTILAVGVKRIVNGENY